MNNNIPINAIVVDDSHQARELLTLMLDAIAPHVRVVGEAENVDDALELINRLNPDLIFLDIEMPEKSGLELVEELARENKDVHVVFTTAYNQYAIRAFRLSAVDYLLKPIAENQLLESVEKYTKLKQLNYDARKLEQLVSNLTHPDEEVLAIPINNGYEYLPIYDIEFIEADRAYSIIHLENGTKKVMSKNMGYFEEVLQPVDDFVKSHRSFLVNLKHMKSFTKKGEGGFIIFKSGKTAEVSRSKKKEVLDRRISFK
jgi:two-component system LytT family response regulator